MEDFREKVLDQTTFKALCGFYYMDDTFVICPYGSERLEGFMKCMNGVHQNITFTVEMERDGHLPHLDIQHLHKSQCFAGPQGLQENHEHRPLA
jgi:hypothetical protein